jgi:hypothetical protein
VPEQPSNRSSGIGELEALESIRCEDFNLLSSVTIVSYLSRDLSNSQPAVASAAREKCTVGSIGA